MIKNMILMIIMAFVFSTAQAETVYVAFKWAAPDADKATDSWIILTTLYDTSTALGMQVLTGEIANHKKTDTVVIYYIRPLRDTKHLPEERTGEIKI